MAKKTGLFSWFRRNDDSDYERYDEDVSFKMPIEDLFEGIKEGTIYSLDEKHYLNADDFLEVDEETGKTLLELVFEKNVTVSSDILRRIYKDTRIIEECLKHKQSIMLYKNSNRMYLDSNVPSEMLFVPLSDGNTLIDHIIDYKMANLYIINRADDPRILDTCLKHERRDLIQYINEEVLFKKYKNYSTIFEYLISKNMVSVYMISLIKNHPEVVEICVAYNKPYLLKHAKEKILLHRCSTGMTAIEYLIRGNNADKETFYNLNYANSNIILGSILRYRAYRYLIYYPEILFSKSGDKLYIDLMLEKYNKSMDMYLADAKIASFTFEQKAIFYLKCAEYGLTTFLPNITINDLLEKKDGKTFIEVLLDVDKEITVKKLLDRGLYKNSNIATILSLYGIHIHGVDVPVDQRDKGLKKKNKYLNVTVSKEIEYKLELLRSLFEKDKKTSPEEIDLLIASYKRLATFRYKYINEELSILIKHKIDNPGFTIIKTKATPYFSSANKEIGINDSSITAFNHELGHAFHAIKTYFGVPEGLYDKVVRINTDEACLNRVYQFANYFEKIEKKALAEAEKRYEMEYGSYFNTNKRAKIRKILEEDRADKIERFSKYGISEKTIKTAVENLYDCTEEDYEKRFKAIKIEELKKDILYENYSALAAMSDMLDAIFEGRLTGGVLKDKNGKKIKLTFGHGISYYNDYHSIFNELIADYSEIIKEKDGEEVLDYLRNIVGSDFVDMIAKYYEENIIGYEPGKLPIEESVGHGI